MRATLGFVVGAVVATLVVFGPNFLWLSRSTARITNDSGRELRDVRAEMAGADVLVGVVGPGQSRFVFLPQTGDATFHVSFVADGEPLSGCQEYVEGSMFHVVVAIGQDLAANCDVDMPLFDRLLWREAL